MSNISVSKKHLTNNTQNHTLNPNKTTKIENDLIFNVIDWHDFDEIPETNLSDNDSDLDKKYSDLDKKYVIKAFGRTLDGKSVYLKINSFPPHFYILLPESWSDNIEAKCDHLVRVLRSKNSNLEHTLEKYEIVRRKKLYGFYANKKFSFLRLVFTNRKAMADTARMFDNKIAMFSSSNNKLSIKERFIKFDVYESNIDPYIRFIHIQNIMSCGWIKVEQENLKPNIEPNTCYYSYSVDWFNVKPIDIPQLAPFKICSFDLECKSGDGTFPQATREEDRIIQIGMTFSLYGSSDITKKIMISLNTCDSIPDTDVYECKTEQELLLKFQEIVHKEDPDVLTGYNIFGFDYPYLMERAKYLKVDSKFYYLSKLKNYKCKLIKKELSSSGLGDNKMFYVDTVGIVNIDLMKVVQRDFRLSSYKLDSVAENFFKDKISELIPITDSPDENIYKIKSKNLQILKAGNFVRFEKDGEVIMVKYKIKEINYTEGYFIISNIDKQLLSKCKLFWGMVKDDIKPKEIFELFEKTSADRRLIAEYCIQDCALVSRLMAKLEILTNNISMASVCHVPLHYIFFRGQGIKSLSLVAKYCRSEGYLVPTMKKDPELDTTNVGYEGATVFEPEIGFHRKPVPVLDYNSLYPSSIISRNVSHETLVTSPEYDNLPGYIYYDVYYNNHDGSQTHCRYAKKVDEYLYTDTAKSKFGIIPTILMGLLSERKAAKKEMAKANDPFLKTILDGKQNALKITANSIYGQLGAPTSPIYFKHGAACTTAIGRDMLCLGRDFVENDFKNILCSLNNALSASDEDAFEAILADKLKERDPKFENYLRTFIPDLFSKYDFKPKVIYGDSVMPNTPVLVKINDEIKMLSVEELGDIFISMGKQWENYDMFKDTDTEDANRHSKERIILTDLNIMSFTNNGWSPLQQLIRHKCNKAIYRVLTHTGLVDVTEDHSLIMNTGVYIKPNELQINSTKLMHNFPSIDPIIGNNINTIKTKEEAKIMGFFVGDGSCGTYESKEITLKYHNLFYDKNKAKIIPKEILYANHDIREAFLEGYYMADGNRKEDNELEYLSIIKTYNQTSAQHLYFLLKSLGYNVSINTRSNKANIFELAYTKKIFRKDPKILKKLDKLYEPNTYNGYVYDLTTTEGVFQAGIGELIVKNTDSIFIKMDIIDAQTKSDLYDKTTLIYNIELGKCASKFLKTLLPYPHNMVYEKTFYPFAQMAKKKYIGNKFEEDPDSFKQTSMGVVLKRRDNANIVKKIVGGMVNIMMNEIDIDKTIRFIKKAISDLLKGKFEIHDFITSKTLKGSYVDRTRLAHVVLADRMATRDPGNAPQLNDRIPFVAIEVEEKKGQKLLQGNKIEHPEYILEHNLKIDYLFYLTNQIQNPSIQFLELMMKPSDADKLFRDFIIQEEDRRKGRQSLSKFGIKKSIVNSQTKSTDTNITNIDEFDFDNLISINAKPNPNAKSKKKETIIKNDSDDDDELEKFYNQAIEIDELTDPYIENLDNYKNYNNTTYL